MILAGQLGFVVLVGGYYGCLPAFMVEAVAVEVRCTAIALGYNVALGLIGAFVLFHFALDRFGQRFVGGLAVDLDLEVEVSHVGLDAYFAGAGRSHLFPANLDLSGSAIP